MPVTVSPEVASRPTAMRVILACVSGSGDARIAGVFSAAGRYWRLRLGEDVTTLEAEQAGRGQTPSLSRSGIRPNGDDHRIRRWATWGCD